MKIQLLMIPIWSLVCIYDAYYDGGSGETFEGFSEVELRLILTHQKSNVPTFQ